MNRGRRREGELRSVDCLYVRQHITMYATATTTTTTLHIAALHVSEYGGQRMMVEHRNGTVPDTCIDIESGMCLCGGSTNKEKGIEVDEKDSAH